MCRTHNKQQKKKKKDCSSWFNLNNLKIAFLKKKNLDHQILPLNSDLKLLLVTLMTDSRTSTIPHSVSTRKEFLSVNVYSQRFSLVRSQAEEILGPWVPWRMAMGVLSGCRGNGQKIKVEETLERYVPELQPRGKHIAMNQFTPVHCSTLCLTHTHTHDPERV